MHIGPIAAHCSFFKAEQFDAFFADILLSVIGSSHSAVIVVVTGLHIGPIDSLARIHRGVFKPTPASLDPKHSTHDNQ